MAESIEEIKKHVRVYVAIFIALAVLTVVTVGASYLHVSTGMHITIALVIALVKASLVAGYFMHLVSERQLIYWLLALCAFFFAAVMMLPALTDSDMAGLGLMSLKAFHLFFVTVSVLLALGLTLWAIREYRADGGAGSLVLACVGVAMAVALVPYGFWFRRKLKHVSYL